MEGESLENIVKVVVFGSLVGLGTLIGVGVLVIKSMEKTYDFTQSMDKYRRGELDPKPAYIKCLELFLNK